MNSSCDEMDLLTPRKLKEEADAAAESIIPEKSKALYQSAYDQFHTWKVENNVIYFSETIFLAYFSELAKKYKPSSLWARYSMLKTMLLVKNNVNLKKYVKLSVYMKGITRGFTGKKSKVLTAEEVQTFITDAPNDQYLLTKVCLIFGVAGACRTCELTNLSINNIEDNGRVLVVNIPNTETKKPPRKFEIDDQFYDIVKTYQSLRPQHTKIDRFFLNYQNGKCTIQPVGKNKLGGMPRIVAEFLKLPDPETYTGHSFRRTSATLLADSGAAIKLKLLEACKSNQATEQYTEVPIEIKIESFDDEIEQESVDNKMDVRREIFESVNVHPSPSTNAIISERETNFCPLGPTPSINSTIAPTTCSTMSSILVEQTSVSLSGKTYVFQT